MPFERRARTGLPCAAVLGSLACDKPALTGRTGLETNCPRGYSLDRSRSELVVTNASTSGLSEVKETTLQGPLCDACYKAMLEALMPPPGPGTRIVVSGDRRERRVREGGELESEQRIREGGELERGQRIIERAEN